MEIVAPEEFTERPVVDIDVEFVGAPPFHWTINDNKRNRFSDASPFLQFFIEETGQYIKVPLRNLAWYSIRKRIDKIPVPKQKASGTGAAPPLAGQRGE